MLKNIKVSIRIIINLKKKCIYFIFLKINLNIFIANDFSNLIIVFINIFKIQIIRLKL